jgi:glycosyltransferase involved in cell wall biosynthesis
MEIKKLTEKVGAVVIGRNEGQRLVTCLSSLKTQLENIIYVDSGSTDNSIEEAQKLGIEIIELDLSVPFTAARARNEGARLLLEQSSIDYIQFVDGDCEVQQNWLNEAFSFLEKKTDYAVACGRRRERYPEQSCLNELCDIEWDTPVGDALSCGGDALIRVSAFKQIKGYNSTLIAGEEPEMCFRLRSNGWKIARLKQEMTLHDAAMTKLSQWWKRAERAGYAYANGFALHGKSQEKFKKKEVVSIAFWGGFLPLVVFALSMINIWLMCLIVIYPCQVLRVGFRDFVKKVRKPRQSFMYALSSIFAKFPQSVGLLGFYKNKLKGQRASIIEYK